jgi:Tfp pilus assembly protein PilV
MQEKLCSDVNEGFGLIEIMIALIVMTFGLLAAGQLIFAASASGSLARAQETAAVAAQNKLESLAHLWNLSPSAGEFSPGDHGPEVSQILNPNDGTVLNRYRVTWHVEGVADPRPGKILRCRLIQVTVVPIQTGGDENKKPSLNKIASITTIFNPRMP